MRKVMKGLFMLVSDRELRDKRKGWFPVSNNNNNTSNNNRNNTITRIICLRRTSMFTCCVPRAILPGVGRDDFAELLLTCNNG